jgi:hypothetical protein
MRTDRHSLLLVIGRVDRVTGSAQVATTATRLLHLVMMILIVYQLFRWPWPFPSLIISPLSHRPPVLLSQSTAALLGFRPADGLVALGSVFFRVMMPANMVAAAVVVVVAVAGPVEFATGFFTLRLFFFSVGDVIIFFFFFVFLAGQTRPRFRQI